MHSLLCDGDIGPVFLCNPTGLAVNSRSLGAGPLPGLLRCLPPALWARQGLNTALFLPTAPSLLTLVGIQYLWDVQAQPRLMLLAARVLSLAVRDHELKGPKVTCCDCEDCLPNPPQSFRFLEAEVGLGETHFSKLPRCHQLAAGGNHSWRTVTMSQPLVE